ncbi:WD40 repeat domain-containing protein [Saprospira grandis]|uniref:WD-40 repeat-containing protein n=1 Tax=Saprospira grandis (strain Lewin) TaxID=984262 RepID=H6L5C4_SAPGL|nr:hypothetical protein [Saprospira grandis]AFC24038.1 WD-40 repeat-containing protein [Saprospira grandis str. Lewin]
MASFEILTKEPYPGLRPYEAKERELFFGRNKQLDELLRKIRGNRFLALVGGAGGGKSSLVRAALVPKLKDGFAGQAGQNWRIAVCQPGNNPIGNLSRQLASRGVLHPDSKMDPNYPAIVEKSLRRGSLGLVDAYKDADVERANLMVVIDQFEEIFAFAKTSSAAQEDAATFVNLLLNASRQREAPIYIVLTMRSDYIGRCTDFRGLPEAINDGQFLIPKMKVEELKKVMIMPVKAVGASIAPDLVSRMIADIGEDFDDLPRLQHLMMRVWDNWVEVDSDPGLPLGIKHYENVGTIKEALSVHAEEAYNKLKTEEQKVTCQRMFRALSERNADGSASRRVATVGELCKLTDQSIESLAPVIVAFSRSDRRFLQAPPNRDDLELDTVISITHESLISYWDRLAHWAEEEHEAAETYTRLSTAAALYFEGKGALWVEPELSLGLKWYEPHTYDEEHPDRLAPTKAWASRYNTTYDETIDFLLKSHEASDKKLRDKKEDDDRKRKTRMLITYLSLGFGAICLILLLLAGVALDSARRSAQVAGRKEKEARLAAYQAEIAKQRANESRYMAKVNANRAQRESFLARQATEKAIRSSDIAELKSRAANQARSKALIALDTAELERQRAEIAKLKAEQARRDAMKSERRAQEERLKAIMTKGLSLAQSVAVKSWKVEEPDLEALLAKEAFELNRVNGGKEHDAYIYEALYKAIDKMQGVGDNPDFNSLNVAPDGLSHLGAMRSIVVSTAEGEFDQKVYTTGSDGWLFKWPLQVFDSKEEQKTAGAPQVLTRNRNNRVYRCMDMNAEGKFLVRAGDEDYMEIWDVAKEERMLKVDVHRGRRVWDLAFLPTGNAVISAGDDRSIKYTNMKGEVTPIVERTPYRVTSIAVSADGQHVAGAGGSPDVSIWNIKSGQEDFKLENPYNKRNATAVAISPTGRFVAVGYQDGSLLIFDIYHYKNGLDQDGNRYIPERLVYHSAKISDLSFSDDGTMLVVGSLDKRATLWQIWNQAYENYDNEEEFPFKDPKFQPIRLEDHEDWVLSVAFTHDGQKVLTGCANGEVKIYEVDMFRYASQLCAMVRRNLSNKEWKKYIGTDDPERDPRNQRLYIITAEGERLPLSTCGNEYPQGD